MLLHVCTSVQVLQVESDGITIFFAQGMAVRDVAEVTRSFLRSMGYGPCQTEVGVLLSIMDAALAALAAAVETGPALRGGSSRGRGSHAQQQQAVYGSTISVMIKTLTATTYHISVPADGFVGHIFQAVRETGVIPVDQQRLVFGGRQLGAFEFLDEAGVIDGVTLHLVLRLAGC